MAQDVITIPFHGDNLTMIEQDGAPYVALKPICERLGIAWQPQHRKLLDPQNDWNCHLIVTVGHALDGKDREMLCISLLDFPLWLASISPSRISEEVREAFLAYRAEAKKVLWLHFMQGHLQLEEQADRLRHMILAANPFWAKVHALYLAGVDRALVFRHVRRGFTETLAAIEEMEAAGIIDWASWTRPKSFALAMDREVRRAYAAGYVPPGTSETDPHDRLVSNG